MLPLPGPSTLRRYEAISMSEHSTSEIWAAPELIQATKDGIVVWRPIANSDGRYEVSNFGRLRSWNVNGDRFGQRREEPLILALNTNRQVYRVHTLHIGGKRPCATVQFFMAEAFIGPRPGSEYEWEAAHHDGIRHNNRLDNIAWKTRKAQGADRARHGTYRYREARLIDGQKYYRCTGCKDWKPATGFGRITAKNAKNSQCKIQPECRKCSSARRLAARRRQKARAENA
jgi:NUMOD4 motif/HNH endonuclease